MTGELGVAPTVSVVSITYNHQDFVREALEGFVRQAVEFPIEVIVADDASTDATQAIIREYADRHPSLFRPILRPVNVGVHANLTDALSAARGEFLAICEGDDYWTDPLKLARQVEFMRENPELGMCFHPVLVTWTDGTVDDSEFPPEEWRTDLSIDHLVSRNFVQTNSVLYRRLNDYTRIPSDVMPLDWYLHLQHAVNGGIGMLAEPMAVYRRHPQGLWHSAGTNGRDFWLRHGRGHFALFDAILDLFPEDSRHRNAVAKTSRAMLEQIAALPGDDIGDLIADIVASRPRLFDSNVRQRLSTRKIVHVRRLQNRWLRATSS